MKLTKAQAKVIYHLQNGGCITHDERYFQISYGFNHDRIQWRVWQALTQELGLIYQQPHYPFDFVLTKKGQDYKPNNSTIGKYK